MADEQKFIELTPEECQEVKLTGIEKDFDKTSKMKGKKYHIATFNGKGFTVKSDDVDLLNAIKNSELYYLKLEDTPKGFSEAGWRTIEGEMKLRKLKSMEAKERRLDAIFTPEVFIANPGALAKVLDLDAIS